MIRNPTAYANAISDREYRSSPSAATPTHIERIQVSLAGGRWMVYMSGQHYQEIDRRLMRGTLEAALAWLDARGTRLKVFPGLLYNFKLNEPLEVPHENTN